MNKRLQFSHDEISNFRRNLKFQEMTSDINLSTNDCCNSNCGKILMDNILSF